MKLIRLESKDNKGFFESVFNTEIIVEPNSKIALQSANFRNGLETLQISSRNDRMSIVLNNPDDGTSENLSITLDEPTFYTSVNYNDFFLDIQKKFNEKLSLKRNLIGLDFRCILTEDMFIQIGYRRGMLADLKAFEFTEFDFPSRQNIDYDEDVDQTIKKKSHLGNTADDIACSIIPLPIGSGCKVQRLTCSAFVDNGDPYDTENNGYKMGLGRSTKYPTAATPNLNFEYMIQGLKDGQPYQFKNGLNQPIQQSTFNASLGGGTPDRVEIAVVGDAIEGRVYRQGQANADLLFSTPYSENDEIEYYMYLSLQGKHDQLTVDNYFFNFDYFVMDDEDAPIKPTFATEYLHLRRQHDKLCLIEAANTLTADPPDPRPIAEQMSGTLTMARQVAEYLGLKKVQTVTEIDDFDKVTTVEVQFLAFEGSEYFQGAIPNDNFIIELNSLDIESYRSEEGRRQNILASIPNISDRGIINYEPNNLYFVDIKNTQKISLRNINARILNLDGSTPSLKGLSVLNILVRGPNE